MEEETVWEELNVISSMMKRTNAQTIEIERFYWANGRKKAT
jgi:hypothetical protein